jgi:catechol 2,3-dioxygenase-like lactoylglutathione lyase family enzyme
MVAKNSLDHVLIVVKDLEKSVNFYKLIGFEYVETIPRPRDRVAVMRLGEISVELMMFPRKPSDIGFRHIGIRVNDLQQIYTKLRDKIQFDSPPRPIAGRGHRMTVFFKDPDGVEIHFVQE